MLLTRKDSAVNLDVVREIESKGGNKQVLRFTLTAQICILHKFSSIKPKLNTSISWGSHAGAA